jgi:hypothetical protein
MLLLEFQVLSATAEGTAATVLVTTTLFAFSQYLDLYSTITTMIDLSFLHIMTM